MTKDTPLNGTARVASLAFNVQLNECTNLEKKRKLKQTGCSEKMVYSVVITDAFRMVLKIARVELKMARVELKMARVELKTETIYISTAQCWK